MILDRTKNSIRNILFGYINRLLCMLCPFFIRTVMIHTLGTEYLGLNSLFSSILQVLNLAELGFSSAIVFNMYKPIANNDTVIICALLSIYRKIYRIVGIVILVLGIFIMPFLNIFIAGTYPKNVNLYVIYFIYLLNTVLSYELFAYKSALLEAHQRTDIESNLASLTNSFMYIIQIVVLICFKNYYMYLIIMPVFTVILNFIRAFIVKRQFPEYFPKGNSDKKLQSEIFIKVKALIIYKVGNVVSNAVDNLVISAFLGLNILAVYNNYYYIISALFSFLMIYYNAVKAGIGNSIILHSIEKNYKDFESFFFAQSWIVGWVSICLLCLFQDFMAVWMGEKLLLPYKLVILFVIYFYTWKIHDVVHTYKDALGMWEEDKYRPLISSGINLLGNLILVKFIGLYGIVLSTIISETFVTMPWAPSVLYKMYFKKRTKIYYLQLLKYVAGNFTAGIFTFIICWFIPVNSIVQLAVKTIICIIIPNIIFLYIYRNNENLQKIKSVLINPILNHFKKNYYSDK